MDTTAYIITAVLILAALGWLFFSDKIVRFFNKGQDDQSWLFPANKTKIQETTHGR